MGSFWIGLKEYQTRRQLHMISTTGEVLCGKKKNEVIIPPECTDATCRKCIDRYNKELGLEVQCTNKNHPTP